MPALPISDEQAASLVPLFPLFNDSEIARQTRLHRTTVGKCRAVWRAQELAKLASVSAYRAPPVEPEPPPTVDKWASCGPPARSPESCRYGEALARTHALDPLSKSGGIDKPPHGMFIHAMAAPPIRLAPLLPGVTAVSATIPSPAPRDNSARTSVGGDNMASYSEASRDTVSRLQRVLFFGDSHHPYNDQTAWRVFLAAAAEFRPDILVCLGDLGDCFSISGYTGDPSRPLKWEDELCAVSDALDQLDAIGAARKVFCGGNHEDRLPRYLAKRAPELFGVATIPGLYHLAERGWEWVGYGEAIKIGHVMVTHDLDRYGIYAVRHALRDAGCSVIIGHVHRACVWYEGSMSGSSHVAASFGWLGGLEWATYRHRVRAERDWQHGFGVGYLEPCGTMHLHVVPIVDGRCVLGGRVIRA